MRGVDSQTLALADIRSPNLTWRIHESQGFCVRSSKHISIPGPSMIVPPGSSPPNLAPLDITVVFCACHACTQAAQPQCILQLHPSTGMHQKLRPLATPSTHRWAGYTVPHMPGALIKVCHGGAVEFRRMVLRIRAHSRVGRNEQCLSISVCL
jgi:hypothetical protein